MSIVNESDIEQLYLSRYDPVLQLPASKLKDLDGFPKKFQDQNLEVYGFLKPKSERSYGDNYSKVSLTSWRNQKLQTNQKSHSAEIGERNLFDRFPSPHPTHQSQTSSPKEPRSPGSKPLFFINVDHEETNEISQHSPQIQNRDSRQRQSVRDVVNVWPPNKNLAEHPDAPNLGAETPQNSSPSGYVRNALKKLHGETPSPPIFMSRERREPLRENSLIDSSKSPSLIKKLTQNHSTSRTPPPHFLPSSTPRVCPDLYSESNPTELLSNDVEQHKPSELPESAKNSPKDTRHFIKAIGPSSPVGLLAFVTRELNAHPLKLSDQNIYPSKILRSPHHKEERSSDSWAQLSKQSQSKNTENAMLVKDNETLMKNETTIRGNETGIKGDETITKRNATLLKEPDALIKNSHSLTKESETLLKGFRPSVEENQKLIKETNQQSMTPNKTIKSPFTDDESNKSSLLSSDNFDHSESEFDFDSDRGTSQQKSPKLVGSFNNLQHSPTSRYKHLNPKLSHYQAKICAPSVDLIDSQTQTIVTSLRSVEKNLQNAPGTEDVNEEHFWTFTTSVIFPKDKRLGKYKTFSTTHFLEHFFCHF